MYITYWNKGTNIHHHNFRYKVEMWGQYETLNPVIHSKTPNINVYGSSSELKTGEGGIRTHE